MYKNIDLKQFINKYDIGCTISDLKYLFNEYLEKGEAMDRKRKVI
jgi:hypothetical protein